MAKPDTKDQILDAAEELFAEQGFVATSLRQLTARAGVNLAAANYHFGSKDELAKAVLQRRIEPINRERRQRLDDMSQPISIEAIVRAFIEPALRSQLGAPGSLPESRGAGLCRLFGRISVERPPFLDEFMREQFGELGKRFVAMLSEAAPGIAAETLWWRMHFMVGAMAHTLANAHVVGQVSHGACDANDHEGILEQLTAFAIGGFAAAEVTR
ncbi:MAG: AcrR family transcriptional regulator [Hyphomicrobiaceae bacterium]|jgi:AcrR family transcriptional regulator